MQSAQKYLKITTWHKHIPIHNLPPLKKDWKVSMKILENTQHSSTEEMFYFSHNNTKQHSVKITLKIYWI